MSREKKIDGRIFGYETLRINDDEIITGLCGEGKPDLNIGTTVTMVGDTEGHIRAPFKEGDEATITEFREPLKKDVVDYIIYIRKDSHEGWVKPSNIKVP